MPSVSRETSPVQNSMRAGFSISFRKRAKIFCPHRAIDNSMIAAQRDCHALADDNLILRIHDGFLHNRAHRQNRRLRWIDDGEELLNAIRAQIRDGNRASLIFFWLELLIPRALGEVLHGCELISLSESLLASRMTGVTSPSSTATATEILTLPYWMMASPAHDALM